MKSIQFSLHPVSALAGAFILALCLVSLGAFAPQVPSNERDISAIQILGQPAPQEMMRITEGANFTVPPEKIFVLTGLLSSYAAATTNGDQIVSLAIDGEDVAAALLYGARIGFSPGGQPDKVIPVSPYGGGPAIVSVPPGLTVVSGQVISVSDNTTGKGVALGYLVDA